MSGRWHWFPALLLTVLGHLCMLIGYSFLFSFIFLALSDKNGNISELTYKITMMLFSLGNYGIYFAFSLFWNKATVNRYYQSKLYRIFTFLVIYAGRALYIYKAYDMASADFHLMSLALMASVGLTIDAINKLQKENE